jgi:hypothetical protein
MSGSLKVACPRADDEGATLTSDAAAVGDGIAVGDAAATDVTGARLAGDADTPADAWQPLTATATPRSVTADRACLGNLTRRA